MSKRTVVLVMAAVMVLIVFGVVRAQEQEYTLDTPTLIATEVDGEVVLSWTEVEGATRYDLQLWDCVNEWRPISENDLRTTQAVHTDPTDEITYLYTVQALNDRGEESDWAAISKNGNAYDFVRETVNPIPSPDFEVVAQDDHIRLQYANVEKAVGYQARVWYEGAGDRWLWLPEENLDLDSRTFSYTDVQPGVDYFFVMRSYSEDKCGFSDWSAYQRHTFAGTGGSTGGGGTIGGGTIGGGTTGGGTTGGGTTGGGTTGGGTTGGGTTGGGTTGGGTDGDTTEIGPGGSTTGPGTDESTIGPTHTPTATGTATATGTPTATPTPLRLPGRISFDSSSSTHNSITVSWHEPDPSALEYVLRQGSGASYETIYTGSDTEYTWTGLDSNTMYHFTVYGQNSPAFPDRGPYAFVLTVRTKVDPLNLAGYIPAAPTNLRAEDNPAGVKLDWTAGAWTPPNDCDCALYGHKIYRRIGSTGARWHHITTSGRRTTYIDRSAKNGRQYVYQVRVGNRHGVSGPSNSVSWTFTRGTPVPTSTPVPSPTPTATTDPCAGVNCPGGNCLLGGQTCSAAQQSCCGTRCSQCHCSDLPTSSIDRFLHLLLHDKMEYEDVVTIFYSFRQMEIEAENARLQRQHPYYNLFDWLVQHEQHQHHAQHEHHEK